MALTASTATTIPVKRTGSALTPEATWRATMAASAASPTARAALAVVTGGAVARALRVSLTPLSFGGPVRAVA
ncbi:hypothetical protein GCM10009734_01430 [Nonomuraea bangladeshensis]